MGWGDSWGSTACNNARNLAKAFYEGRELGGSKPSRVVRSSFNNCLEYYANGVVIAKWTPPWMIGEIVADAMENRCVYPAYLEPVYCPVRGDKCEARHFDALGLDATWQYSGKPFLLEGVCTRGHMDGYQTKVWWQAQEKWVEPTSVPRVLRVRFENRTLPLFT
jgi:hypothetical protein